MINFGSSIGIEALLQGKCLINPHYLHDNDTVFEKTGAAYTSESLNETIEFIRKFKQNELEHINNACKEDLYSSVIYGSSSRYDILDYYWRRITKRKTYRNGNGNI